MVSLRMTGALALFFNAAGAGHAQDSKQTPLKVISSLPSAGAAVTYTVPLRGFDKRHGLAVDITQSGGSSTLQVDAVLAGSVLFGHPGTATALQAIREGTDLKLLGAIAKNQMVAIMSNAAFKKTGISPTAPIGDRIKALKGLTIGTNPVGSTYTQMLVHYLKQYGLDPETDVRLVGVTDSTALITGIDQGRFDVIVSASGVRASQMRFCRSADRMTFDRHTAPGNGPNRLQGRCRLPPIRKSCQAVRDISSISIQQEPAMATSASNSTVQSFNELPNTSSSI